jgi:hypothetical protein
MPNLNLSLFPEEYPEREYYAPTLEPDEPIEPIEAEIPEVLGSDFVSKNADANSFYSLIRLSHI